MLGPVNRLQQHSDPKIAQCESASVLATDEAISQLKSERNVSRIKATLSTVSYQLNSQQGGTNSPIRLNRRFSHSGSTYSVPSRHVMDRDHENAILRLQSLRDEIHQHLHQHDLHIDEVLSKRKEKVTQLIHRLELHHRLAMARHVEFIDKRVHKLHMHNIHVQQHRQDHRPVQSQAGHEYKEYVRHLSTNQSHHQMQLKGHFTKCIQPPSYGLIKSMSMPEPKYLSRLTSVSPTGSLPHDWLTSPAIERVRSPVYGEERASSPVFNSGCAPFEMGN